MRAIWLGKQFSQRANSMSWQPCTLRIRSDGHARVHSHGQTRCIFSLQAGWDERKKSPPPAHHAQEGEAVVGEGFLFPALGQKRQQSSKLALMGIREGQKRAHRNFLMFAQRVPPPPPSLYSCFLMAPPRMGWWWSGGGGEEEIQLTTRLNVTLHAVSTRVASFSPLAHPSLFPVPKAPSLWHVC